MICRLLIRLLTGSTLCSGALIASTVEKLSFNQDIRPILSDKCFHCHGPDAKTREAGLRLDTFDGAIADGAIVPGHPERSEILARIRSAEADEHMPPADSKIGSLGAREIERLERWIREGATYEAHWAFLPLKDTPNATASSIDAIVSQALAKRGMKLQPRADAATLLRRLSFDLTGLPPSATEVQSFLKEAAQSEDAYARKIRQLLASPAYGERMASDWLDVARYADSYGFQVDRLRDVWPWRDWVIKAFNTNLPYDRFITWQIAGDLLPNATDEQILATAFQRLHQQESEGGSVEEEYRTEYVADRVQTFATAFLGLTFECARCHDHKYDPITQKEYYGLAAFLQNIDEAGLYSFFTDAVPTPALMMMEPSTKQKLVDLQTRATQLEQRLREAGLRPLETLPLVNDAPADLSQQIAHYSFDKLEGRKLADGQNPSQPDSAATLKGDNQLAPGRIGQAIRFTGDDSVDTPVGHFQRHEPFSLSLWLKTPDYKERAVILHRSRAWTDAGSRGYELLIEEGRLKWSLIHFWPGNAISIRTRTVLPLGEWVQVIVTNDGSSRADGLRIFLNGQRAEVDVVRDHLTKNITGGGGDTIALGERFRDRGFKDGLIDDLRVFKRDLSQSTRPDLQPLLQELQEVRAAITQLSDAQKEIMVMREMAAPKTAYILTRGEYDKRAEPAPPVTPAVLPPFPSDAPRNRLGLAQWLTAPNHPLTARVMVNRIWQSLFGRGLVKTSEDFGSQGEKPLYPELLDYLALRFIRSGWNVKALVEEIVSSQTYQQRSFATAALQAEDPDNQWLAQGPRFRLSAEMIRDNALASAGLLNLQIGGPPVVPYEMTEAFKPVEPGNSHRRSLYSIWRRTSPPPAMVAFDAPRRAVCTVKRERTDSPLQALILLNGTQYVEAARVLGEKLHQDAQGNITAMIEQGFLRCLSRLPDAREIAICQQLYQEQLKHFQAHSSDAESLLKTGSAPRIRNLPAAEAAAATALAQALLNHDAAVVKR